MSSNDKETNWRERLRAEGIPLPSIRVTHSLVKTVPKTEATQGAEHTASVSQPSSGHQCAIHEVRPAMAGYHPARADYSQPSTSTSVPQNVMRLEDIVPTLYFDNIDEQLKGQDVEDNRQEAADDNSDSSVDVITIEDHGSTEGERENLREVRLAMLDCGQTSASTSAPHSAMHIHDIGSYRKSAGSSEDILTLVRSSSYDSLQGRIDETEKYDTEELEEMENWFWVEEENDEKFKEQDIEDNRQEASDDSKAAGQDEEVIKIKDDGSTEEEETLRASDKPDGTCQLSKKRKMVYREKQSVNILTKKLKKM